MVKRRAAVSDSDSDAPVPNKAQKRVEDAPSPSGRVLPENTHAHTKEKVLVLCSRGITFRYRHLMLDLIQLLPHHKKDVKLDTKAQRNVINEVAEMKGCASTLYFETRKKKDLYLWMAKTPLGPTFKFHVSNVHTMAELKLSGNHLKGSRPVLSFDKNFDLEPHWQLLKEVLTQVFATPENHPKSKPFFDHILTFSIADGRVWMRNYQIVLPLDKKKPLAEGLTTVEVGPRLCLNPIIALDGGFGGRILYENPTYVSPNAIRAALKAKKGGKYTHKVVTKERRKAHEAANPVPVDPLANVFRE